MSRQMGLSRNVLAAAAVAALLAGGGAALAATSGGGGTASGTASAAATTDGAAADRGARRAEFASALASALGIDASKVQSALDAIRGTRPEPGQVAAALASELGVDVSEVEAALEQIGLPPGGPHRGPGPGLEAAADYLGLSQNELRDALMSGKSLADVAKSQGKSVQGLEDALVADATEHLNEAVADGRITQAEANARLGELNERVDDLVTTTGPPAGGGCALGGDVAPPSDSGQPSGTQETTTTSTSV
jgi:hypothetical protein